METYELWRTMMYAVGVFATCNVAGLALRRVFARMGRKPDPESDRAYVRMGVRTPHGMKVLTDPAEIAAFLSRLSPEDRADARQSFDVARQTFEDIRRQIDTPEAPVKAPDEPDKASDEQEDFFSD